MQQLLKRFYDVIKVRIRFANSQLKKKPFWNCICGLK